MGWVTSDFGSSPGWWAVTVASHYQSRKVEHFQILVNATKEFDRHSQPVEILAMESTEEGSQKSFQLSGRHEEPLLRVGVIHHANVVGCEEEQEEPQLDLRDGLGERL